MIGNKPFIGKEIEGPDKDLLTIFIPKNSVPVDKFLKLVTFARRNKTHRFYFGAGDCQGCSDNDVLLIEYILNGTHVSTPWYVFLEVTGQTIDDLQKIKHLGNRVRVIFCIQAEPFTIHHIKCVGNSTLLWKKVKNKEYWTKLTDQEYKNDLIIDL